jgi:PEGA domain/FecR protein
MKKINSHDDPCLQFEETIVKSEISNVEYGFLKEHMNVCELCEMEYRFSKELSNNPIPPMDDISKRTIINSLVEKVDIYSNENQIRGDEDRDPIQTMDQLHEFMDNILSSDELLWDSDEPALLKKSSWKIPLAVAATIMVAISGFLFVLMMKKSEMESSLVGKGKLVMVSGKTISGTGQNMVAGSLVAVGSKLNIQGEGTVLFLPKSTHVLLGKKSVSDVSIISKSNVKLNLSKGRLFASVDRKSGDPIFTVGTPYGDIVVTGTLFSVEVKNGNTFVSVLRGSVKIVQKGKSDVFVVRGRSFHFGENDTINMDNKERKLSLEGAALLNVFKDSPTSELVVKSLPSGAELFVEGVYLGKTPVTSLFISGNRKIVVSKDGYSPVKNHLNLKKNEKMAFLIHLKRLQSPVKVDVDVNAPKVVENTSEKRHDIIKVENDKKTKKTVRVRTIKKVVPKEVKLPLPTESKNSSTVEVLPKDKTPLSLLKKARKWRASKNWKKAALAYRLLLKHFPKSGYASMSRISLGILLLDHLGKPAASLKLFSAYLKASGGNGILAQEAAWGEIRALKSLGKIAREKRALKAFLKRWPNALQSTQAKHRLSKI